MCKCFFSLNILQRSAVTLGGSSLLFQSLHENSGRREERNTMVLTTNNRMIIPNSLFCSLFVQLSLCPMHQHRSGNNLLDDNQLTPAETSRMKVISRKEKTHQIVAYDVLSTCPCGASTQNSAKTLQYSS